MIETIRLSQQAKEHLIRLKRHTGIKQWNILCRWALCTSLAEPSTPAPVENPADSNVEMTWKVFAGEYRELYWALIRQRCLTDHLEPTELEMGQQFRRHLHRGIGYLAADRSIRSVEVLVSKPVYPRTQ
jgi:DNA sulfur modification protein DndE